MIVDSINLIEVEVIIQVPFMVEEVSMKSMVDY